MSIVIRTEELNYLIYMYFQEQGLNHSAFSLANEVQMEKTRAKYNDEVKPGQLINVLEKALLFQQLQDHIHLNQYFECKVPTHLIQKHVCQFTERKNQTQKQEKRERELIISNALMRSQEFLVAKNGQTIDQVIETQESTQLTEDITLLDWNPFKSLLAIYQSSINSIKIIQREGFITQFILPTMVGENFLKVRIMKFDKATGGYLLVVFENGAALVSDTNCQVIKMFNIKNTSKMTNIIWNHNWPNVVTIVFESDVEIIDIFKCQTIRVIENCQYFEWRFYDQYISMDNNFYISLNQIDLDRPLLQLKAELDTTLVEFNKSKTLLASFSSSLNNIKVWTLLNDQYVFEITDDLKILQFCWCSSQNANYLITLTETLINIWDVEFGQIKCCYNIDFTIHRMVSLDLLRDSPSVALVSTENKIHIYDLINRKRRIMTAPQLPNKIVRLSEDEVLLQFQSTLVVVNIKKME